MRQQTSFACFERTARKALMLRCERTEGTLGLGGLSLRRWAYLAPVREPRSTRVLEPRSSSFELGQLQDDRGTWAER